MMNVARRLRELLASPESTFVMEAHSPLSARVAETSGFPALWASGLTISSAMGLSRLRKFIFLFG